MRKGAEPSRPGLRELPGREFLALLAVLYLGMLPLFSEFTWRIVLYITALFTLAAAVRRYPRLRPHRLLLLLLTLGSIALVLTQFHTVFGYQAGIALYALMLSLKTVESRSYRDFYVLYILGLFLMVAQFLLHQGMGLAAGFLGLFVALNAILVHLNRAGANAPVRALRQSGVLLLQALPLAAVLFLLFPRLSSPLWSIDVGARTGVTGLSDQMEPGSVNRLILSREPVFRVEFAGSTPTADLLYWRGPVFWHTDGRRWSGGPPSSVPAPLRERDDKVDYRLILESTGKPWIPALDLPDTAPPGVRLSGDRQLIALKAVSDRKQYRLSSYTRYHTGPLEDGPRRAALQLPDSVDSRVRDLARGWRRDSGGDRGVVDLALRHFNQQPFVYTLNPPVIPGDMVAGFLFDTRAGFCEHYAASFTLLMRLAGIPSRVVTGYLGGEYNGLGDYILVRQSDAHAWSEVWLPQSGWTRIDPTAAVAPQRVLHGIVPEQGDQGAPAMFALDGGGMWTGLGRRLVFALDALNTNWHLWILDYDHRRRGDILSWLGLSFLDERGIGLLMVALSAAIVVLIWWNMQKQGGFKEDPVINLYRLFCRRLGAVGIEKSDREGPLDFAKRASRLRPDLGPDIRRIIDLYIRIRYRGARSEPLLKRFRLEVRRFKPVGDRSRPTGFSR
jgi:transglutaminase-like putative cysteine protease